VDSDPGGPKTCGSGGSGSATLVFVLYSGLSAQLAQLFIASCPRLERLRDVASWGGSEEAWAAVVAAASAAGLRTGWAEKTRRVALYTIDYDAEGWVQLDTGHKFELYNNLNDDWEVVDNEAEMQALGRHRNNGLLRVHEFM
jgi:hypothetical protein